LGWLVAVGLLVAGLGWYDRTGNGLADVLHACNLALSRSPEPAADVVVFGSSRTGVAIDPVAMQSMLREAADGEQVDSPSVERLALTRGPLRSQVALLENYLQRPGRPQVIVFEIGFLHPRNVELFEDGSGLSAEEAILRRDIDLMTYGQIWGTPAVARPYGVDENAAQLWSHRLGSIVRRSGALLSRFVLEPRYRVDLANCQTEDFLGGAGQVSGLRYSYGDSPSAAPPRERIAALREEIEDESSSRDPEEWQEVDDPAVYPYDVDQPYRAGEMALLEQAIGLADSRGVPIVLLPLTLVDQRLGEDDRAGFESLLQDRGEVFDLYGANDIDISTYWFDDAHLEQGPAVELMTALLAEHLVDQGLVDLDGEVPGGDGDT
jgi:hypothetical protein